MVKKMEISLDVRNQIVGLYKGGYSQRDISKIISVHRNTKHSILRKWLASGTTKNHARCGRPKKLTDRDLRSLRITLRKNRWATLSTITHQFNEDVAPVLITPKTVSRRLHEMGYYARVAKRKPLISTRNKKKRLVFYKAHKAWSLSQWRSVIWSDESRFKLFKSDGRSKVWRKKGETYKSDCIVNTVQGYGGSVLIWACFCHDKLGPCIVVDSRMNSTVYINDILKPFHRKFYSNLVRKIPNLVLMQDNAPCHTSGQTRKWLTQKKIKLLTWPPQSPDMNPIESLWDILEKRINARSNRPKNLRELKEVLLQEWNELPAQTLCKLVESYQKDFEL